MSSNVGDVKGYPKDFTWGTATASYQIEGGWDRDGKGASIWDTFTHKSPSLILDGSTGDDACKSYDKYEEDIEMLKYLGVSHYRFSISWPRVIPSGRLADGVNKKGVEYYKTLITKLKQVGIEPMVTLYHWDLPQSLEDDGGWRNESIIKHFIDYCGLMFRELGDQVNLWITFNEPRVVCWIGHGLGMHAPGIKQPGETVYQVAHNIIRAHAAVYREYHKMQQGGKIGIACNISHSAPKDNSSQKDVDAVERRNQFKLGWFAHPIFKDGDYPQVMKTRIADKSKKQGFSNSRLPSFTDEEKQLIKGSSDFFGLNFYTSRLVEHKNSNSDASYENDQDLVTSSDPTWKDSSSSWLKMTPFGMRSVLNWIKSNYGDIPIYITENGFSDNTGCVNDDDRIEYYQGYIENMRLAIVDDAVNVRGYTAWSLMDNFEWAQGYTEKFGLFSVDFTKSNRPRTAKTSAEWYKKYIEEARKNSQVL